MSLRQAAEQALEALRYTTDHLPAKTGVERYVDDAITALQVALSQPEWVGLTREEFEEAVDDLEDLEDCWVQIEAKLKEKNT